jgi:hypothetical protein
MSADFSKVAPYLQDPLVLIGFVVLLFFSFARFIVKQGLIPKLTKNLGYRVLQTILLYGFIIGLAIILLGFGLKYREMSEREQRNAVSLLNQEFTSNMQSVGELSKNTETLLQLMSSTAVVLRHPKIKLLPVLFPEANLELGKSAKPAVMLANRAIDSLAQSGLHREQSELDRLTSAGRAIRSTVERTIGTVRSLADGDHARYVIHKDVWESHLPIIRKVNLVPVTTFQESYTDLDRLRSNYDVLVARVIDYLESLRDFFDENQEITRERLASVLTAERLAFQIAATYGDQLVTVAERLSVLQRQIAAGNSVAPTPIVAERAGGGKEE